MTSDEADLAHVVTELRPEGGVVVGDDGSTWAAAALVAAAHEAVRRGCVLHVVRAWTITNAVRPEGVPRGMVPSLLEFEAATRAFEEQRVGDLLAGLDVAVQVHTVHSAPAKALVLASETADLLVVGPRGVGGFKRLLLGSVADQCVRYSACSVLVARERE